MRKFKIILIHFPSIIGGGLYIFMNFLMVIPPFTLGAIFSASEIANEIEIQQAISPDMTRTAHVFFRGVGAYSGGNGRIYIRIRHNVFPIVERDIFYLQESFASENDTNYIEWRDNDTIYISETKQELNVGFIEAQVPDVFTLPFGICSFLTTLTKQAIENRQMTVAVKDIPIYPGNIFGDQSTYDDVDNTIFRSFNIDQVDVDIVESWYEEVLSNPPWKIIKVDRYSEIEIDKVYIRYCIQAMFEIDNEQQIYYWEFMGTDDISQSVHVNIGTPNPITDTCGRYVEYP
jgi:hypothetical protein